MAGIGTLDAYSTAEIGEVRFALASNPDGKSADMKRHMKNEHGMTFIELMTTVTVIGIVAAMAVPKFEIAYNRMEMRSANKNINSALKLARSMAISDKERYGLYFDNQKLTMTIFKDLVNTSKEDFVSGDSVVRIDSLPHEFSLLNTDCDGNVIVFRPNGSAAFTGGGQIFTYASGDNAIASGTHEVMAATGRVSYDVHYY